MLKLIFEFGPLIVFLCTYKYSDIVVATIVMAVVTALCMFFSYLIDKKISVPLILSGGTLILAGIITFVTKDPKYIKMKPTFVYVIFCVILFFGSMMKKPLLKQVLGSTITMADQYWLRLAYRFCIFFFGMAVVNELVWRNFSESAWVNFKVFGAIPLALAFMASQIPFLYKSSKNK